MESVKTILKGTMISVLLTLVLLLIFATVLTYSNVAENTIPAVIIVITAISLLVGASIANRKIKKMV
jgi:putative membrane protein (TIGR04086 family)